MTRHAGIVLSLAGFAVFAFAAIAGARGAAPAPAVPAAAAAAANEPGFVKLFNGKDLTGWAGDPNFWSVQDGAIVGQTTKDKPTKGNTFLVWKAGETKDFDLRMKFNLVNHNSGIQVRSKQFPGNFVVGGYQGDMDEKNTYTGMLYEERGRGILGKRGTKLEIDEAGKKVVKGQTCTDKEFFDKFQKDGWNEYRILGKGNLLTLWVNGVMTFELTDNQEAKRAMSGILALQLHAGQPMKVLFKDIRMKTLE